MHLLARGQRKRLRIKTLLLVQAEWLYLTVKRMARILETKGLKMDLDNPTKAQKAKLKKLKPEMYEKLFKKASTK